MKLHSHPLSGSSHKVRLLLSMLKLDYEAITVDLLKGEQKSPEFLALNPIGQVPVLVDGEAIIRDSQAILVYLARKYGDDSWLPTDALQLAHVMQWLSFAANEIYSGPNMARLHFLLGLPMDIAAVQDQTRNILRLLNDHLGKNSWLALGRPTIADLAVYPYIGLAPEGKVSLDDYPHVQSWIQRVRDLPGYVSMPGL